MGAAKRNVTLVDIAKRAGISISTASRVLNQTECNVPISARTREKVLSVAREMGYMPSMAARALRSGATRTIGVLGTSPEFFISEGDLSNQHVSFVHEILRGLFRAAIGRGYNLTLLTAAEFRTGTEMDLLSSFGMVDGLLVLNRDLSADDLCANTLRYYSKPLVYALDYQDDDRMVVAPDDTAGGALATRTLVARGHRKIAFLSLPQFADIFRRRKAGWEIALREAGLDPAGQPFVPDTESVDLAELCRQGCTAAVCANIPVAELAAEQCLRAGLALPGRMELVGFFHESAVAAGWCQGCGSETVGSEDPASDRALPRFASVVSPLAEIIADGCHRLIDLIQGLEVPEKKKLFPYRMQFGHSCPENRHPFAADVECHR